MLEKYKFWKNLRKPKPETKNLPDGWGGKPGVEKPGEKGKPHKDIFTDLKHGRSNKIRVPGLRFFNQGLLVILLILNFFISQAALISATPSMFFLFFANSYGIFYGLWKSRSQRETLEA